MPRKNLALLVGAVLYAVAGSALAFSGPQSTAYVSATNFQVNLTDLDLNDGITPSFTYTAPGSNGTAMYLSYGGPKLSFHRNYRDPAFWDGGTITKTVRAPDPLVAGRLDSLTSVRGNSLETLVVEVRARTEGTLGAFKNYADLSSAATFVLSPNTALSLSYDLTVDSALAGSSGDGVAASSIRVGVGSETHMLEHFVRNYGDFVSIGIAQTQTFTTDLSSGKNALEVPIGFSASVGAQLTTPVPEPETYAMLLAGLGMVGVASRRSRRSRPSRHPSN